MKELTKEEMLEISGGGVGGFVAGYVGGKLIDKAIEYVRDPKPIDHGTDHDNDSGGLH